ncbi:MAG: DUF1232 domain-containing protein [Bacteroidales bacterium]|nr:DUF1232 domain-containing protein [Bacteroidales bacterium]
MDTEKYRKYFTDSAFWDKLSVAASKMGLKLTWYSLVLYYTMIDPATPRKAKMVILGSLGYLILPIDLIPDFLPGGHLDDLGVITAAVWQIMRSITPEIKDKATRKLYDWFPKARPEDIPEIDEQ